MELLIETYRSENGRVRIELCGRLDTLTSSKLEDTLAKLNPQEAPLQVLDMTQLDYISSAGIRCVVKARMHLMAQQGHLLLLNMQPQVRKVFDIIKAIPAEQVFTNLEELDDYLDTIQRRARN